MAEINDPSQERPSLPRVIDEQVESQRLEAIAREHPEPQALAEAIAEERAPDVADVLEDRPDSAVEVVAELGVDDAAEVLSHMELSLAAGVLEELIDADLIREATDLLEGMEPDDAADLLNELQPSDRNHIFVAMDAALARRLRTLCAYDEDTAGGIMNPDALALEAGISVRHSVDKIRTWETSEHVTHLPLVDGEQRLLGMLPLRRLLLAPPDSLVDGLIDETYESLPVELDQESVAAAFDRHDYVLMPVVDDLDRLLGIITVDDVIDIIREEATEDAQKQVGAGGYEAVWSTAIEKYRGRTPWLMVSVLSLIPALGVVALFEDTIEQVAVLAVLMPLAAAITGNAGHQALAVTLRGITLNEMRRVRIGRLLRRELVVGLSSGLSLGVLVVVLLAALGWVAPGVLMGQDNWKLGSILGLSMTVSLGVGTIAGVSIPLVMRRLGFDPAQSSAIFLIMITDAIGLLSFLGFAALGLKWLQGVGA